VKNNMDQKDIDAINKMSRLEMARLWRFAQAGHIYFDTSEPISRIFKNRFEELGGFSAEISKIIGL